VVHNSSKQGNSLVGRAGATHHRRVTRYTFGDSDAAAGRLGLVASAYEPTSRALLERLAAGGRVVDLGCGPGDSTQLLADVCRPTALVGLDASAAHVERARRRVPRAAFAVHDVTALPLPGGPADLLYARLVLAHLPAPRAVVEGWRTQLAPGGVLVVEDLEAIDAPAGPLREYDALSAAVVATGGGPMYAGRDLAGLGGDVVGAQVDAAMAARIYRVNVAAWRADGRRVETDLAALEGALDAIADGAPCGPVTWHVRQLVLSAS
jgi:SAM-dependent methyltransferase